jgi:RNA polymerase sigma-70 factor (ECF subfamily)
MDNPDYFNIINLTRGDTNAFKALYDKYKKKLYGYALYLSKNAYDAEEIVQIAFISVWENRTKLDPDKPFSQYLFRIVQNRLCDLFRRRIIEKCYIDYIKANETDISDDFLSTIINTETEEIFNKLLDQMPEKRRTVFKLSRYGNLTYKQIAQQLHISENTVDFHIRQSLSFLKKELKKYYALLIIILVL